MKNMYLKRASLFVLGINLFSVAYGMDEDLSNSSSIERVFTRTPPQINNILTKTRDALVTEKLTPLLEQTLSSFAVFPSSPRVFISYAWPKRVEEQNIQPFLLTLVNHLKKSGIHALLDLLDLKPGSHIDTFMEDGIADSHAILVMGTPTYYTRSQEETNVRYEFIRIAKEASKAIPLSYVEEPPVSFLQVLMSDRHSPLSIHTSENYFLIFPRLIASIYQKAGLTFSLDYWKEYLSSCKTILEAITPEEVLANKERLEHEAQASQEATQQRIIALAENLPFDERFVPEDWSIPFPSSFFVGRDDLLNAMGQILKNHPNEALVLEGPLGSGKKQLAYAYAKKFIGRYTFGAFVPGGDFEPLITQLGLSSIDALQGRLSKEKWLLIFSDVEDLDQVKKVSSWSGGHVVATSSRSFLGQKLSVPALSPEASQSLLTLLTGQDLPDTWSALSENLAYRPQDLVFFAHYLRQNLAITPQDLLSYTNEDVKQTIRTWAQTAKGLEILFPRLLRKFLTQEVETTPLKDIVLESLLRSEINEFCQKVEALSFDKKPIWMTFPWTPSQNLLLFAKNLFQDLGASGSTPRYELEDRTPFQNHRDYQRLALSNSNHIILVGTSAFMSPQGQDLLSQVSSHLTNGRVLPIIREGGFGVFPETYKHILMEDMQTPLAYAKSFPRILGIITSLGENSYFKALVEAYLAKVDACTAGLTEDLIKSKGRSLQDQDRQVSSRNWLKIKSQATALGFDIPPRFWNIRDPELKIGRDTILHDMEKRLDDLDPITLRQVVLTGLGGMGKSHMAACYAGDHQNRYTFGFNINAAFSETFSISYRALGEALGLTLPDKDGEMIAAVKDALESPSNAGWILVMDNADTPNLVKTHLPTRGGHILITSRSQDWEASTLLPLDHLEHEASIQLLETRSGLKDPEGADALAQKLGDHPLAMVQAGAYIKENKLSSFTEYLDLLSSSGDMKSAVSSTWAITLQKIQAQSPDGLKLLQGMSFFSPDQIPLSLLKAWVSEDWKQEGFPLNHRLGEALRALQSYSMVESTRQDVSLHRLVQEALRDALSEEEKKAFINRLLTLMQKEFVYTFKSDKPKTWVNCQFLTPHADQLFRHGEEILGATSGLFEITSVLSQLAERVGKYTEFMAYSQKSLTFAEKLYAPNHPYISDAMSNLGLAYGQLGNYDLQLSFVKKALAVIEENSDIDLSLLASSLRNVGKAYGNLGNYSQQLYYLEKALVIEEKIHASDHPEIARILNDISIAYGNLGDYNRQLISLRRAFAIIEKTYGQEHPYLATVFVNIGGAYGNLGDYSQQVVYLEKALAIEEKIYGPDHPTIATSLSAIGDSYGNLGDYNKQLKYSERALAIRKKNYEQDHPEIASSLSNIGTAYGNMENYRKMLSYLQEALAIREKTLSSNHPDIALTLNNLGMGYGMSGNYILQVSFLQRSLKIYEHSLDSNHPRIAGILNNIGLAQMHLGQNLQAISYFERALDIWKKTLPCDHPDIATILNNIGMAHGNLGELKEMMSYSKQSLAIREKTLGGDHPSFAISLNNLGLAHMKIKEYREAISYYVRALSVWEKTLDSDNASIVKCLINIGVTYGNLGEKAQKLSYLQRALVIRERTLDPSLPSSQTIINAMRS